MPITYIVTPFATSGDVVPVPDAVQPDGSVSFTQGYGPDYSLAQSDPDKLNVERTKMNYLFNEITALLQNWQQQAIPNFIPDTENLGDPYPYDQYAIVRYDAGGGAKLYQSLIDSNTDTPPSANWAELPLGFVGTPFTTGDAKLTLKTSADSGWVIMNDGTIGSASSGATTRANADTQALYTLIWNNISNTYAPVGGGRGANATADFNANKPIALTKQLGRALCISGTGSGLSARALGQTIGSETILLDTTMIPAHNHTINITDPQHSHTEQYNQTGGGGTGGTGSNASSSPSSTGAANTLPASTGITASSTDTGGGLAHDNMQPSAFWNIMIKL